MIKNVSFRQLVHNDLTIEGFSRAAVQSFWRIPELKIGFDLGAHPWEPHRFGPIGPEGLGARGGAW